MSLKTQISARLSSFLLDPERQRRRRAAAERRRRRHGLPHEVHFFHQVDDPYSHLLAQALVELHRRYDITLRIHLVAAPVGWAAPERDRLRAYSIEDARALARRSGFAFDATSLPDDAASDRALERAASLFPDAEEPAAAEVLPQLISIGEDLWSGDAPSGDDFGPHTQAVVDAGTRRRDRLGHYLGSTCWYGGEWTWGIDRLGYLEERLDELGARRSRVTEQPEDPPGESRVRCGAERIYVQPTLLEEKLDESVRATPEASVPELHFFLSFRSPYTYIATPRVIELARVTGAELKLRFVLPMVMRGLPVKRSKRFYILRDAAREARRLGVPFAPVADPVGRAVERGYSLLPWAIDQGRGPDYCLSFMTHVWSRALDAASDRGLQRIVEDAGLDWSSARPHLDDPAWKTTAEENRQELLDLGLWGVPSFLVGSLAVWGQDRLWRVEEALQQPSTPESLDN